MVPPMVTQITMSAIRSPRKRQRRRSDKENSPANGVDSFSLYAELAAERVGAKPFTPIRKVDTGAQASVVEAPDIGDSADGVDSAAQTDSEAQAVSEPPNAACERADGVDSGAQSDELCRALDPVNEIAAVPDDSATALSESRPEAAFTSPARLDRRERRDRPRTGDHPRAEQLEKARDNKVKRRTTRPEVAAERQPEAVIAQDWKCNGDPRCFFGAGLDYHHDDCPYRDSSSLDDVVPLQPSEEDVVRVLQEHAGSKTAQRKRVLRILLLRTHPDKGGDDAAFRLVEERKDAFLGEA